ncbi:MAG: protein kinase [Phycisphaerales bacterium]
MFWLEQVPQGHTWLLKIFTPGRRPTDEYLRAVDACLPGATEFFTCTQRRFLTRDHLDRRASAYQHPALADILEGAVMMPKVPGTPWAAAADDLRSGALNLSWVCRLKMALALAQAVDLLEAAQCSHRDLSASNVFVTPEGKVYLIDWDCLYHPHLPFQANTTLGTMGYLPPFRAAPGNGDPTWSWCPHADRFALGVLVAEMLLIGPQTPPAQEDGTLLGQAQIDEPRNPFVRQTISRLTGMPGSCGSLLQRAFSSSTLDGCPAPGDWIAALRHMLKGATGSPAGRPDAGNGRSSIVHLRCSACHAPLALAKAKYEELTERGKPILCKNCLSKHLAQSSLARAQRQAAFPHVSCEHCHHLFSMPRPKLDDLRRRGRPILCPACLGPQIEKWRAERATCESGLDAPSKPVEEIGLGLKSWSFIRRILHGYSI